MNFFATPLLKFCLLGSLALPLTAASPGASAQIESASTGYTVEFSCVKGEGNSFTLTLRTEGFKGCRLETWKAPQEGVRRNAMIFPQRADGSVRGSLIQELNPEDEGRLTVRLVDLVEPTRELWLVLAPTTTLGSGRIQLLAAGSVTPNMPVICKTWCFRAILDCTSGRQISRCCDQSGPLIYNDTGCTIICTSCP